jgi:hypothetical protein
MSTRLDPELVAALKRLKLGPIADTLPDRLVLATILEQLLPRSGDGIQRRDSTAAERRARDGR